MARSRYTITDLRNDVAELNENLAEAGSDIRFKEQGRNGYQAVDEYRVDPETGERPDTCVRMVGGGTSREVRGYMYDRYNDIMSALQKKRLEDENAELRQKIDTLTNGN